MKIGLMGGTFDPPHKAHIIMAKAALNKFSLDKVIFMTGGNPPHKRTNTDAKIRNHMMKLAISGYDDFEICDYEIKKEGYSYTSDTLQYLKETNPDDSFYFIIGGDSLRDIFTWHEPYKILTSCTILVYSRDGYPTREEVREFNKNYNSDVRLLDGVEEDISSTDIRDMIEDGIDASKYLDCEVWEYIKRNNLYPKEIEPFEEHLKKMLKPARYIHSIGVASTAVGMAGIFHIDQKKAYIAGLLHDCAKNLTDEEAKIKYQDLEVELDEFEKDNNALAHAKIGAELVKVEFGIDDDEIIGAIRWHTLGNEDMTKLEKIIFVADMIEPNRSYPEVELLRKAAFTNIDTAVLECVSATIDFNEEKGKIVHPNAYKLKNRLLADGVKYMKDILSK